MLRRYPLTGATHQTRGVNTVTAAVASRRAYLVWGAAVAAYVVAVLQRTSLGVAGLAAVERFDTTAGILATLAVLQLLVYVLLQIPVGLAVDRVGPRVLLVTGAAVMATGETTMALADDTAQAVVARIMVGTGDAMTFVSVLRLVAAWFPPRRAPLMTQLTAIVGALGQVLSAVPFVLLLQGPGWSAAFASAAALSAMAAVAALLVVRDAPHGTVRPELAPLTAQAVRDDLATVWRHPGTRLGLWTHFTTQFSATVFLLLWGYPFLVSAQGLSPSGASALLTLNVAVGLVTAPVMGELAARHPLRRSWLVVGTTVLTALTWAVVLALPDRSPHWLLVVLVSVLALGGPASAIGFDFGRTFVAPHRLGAATGVINVGGFTASLITIYLIGLVLDARTPRGEAYDLGAFRAALSVQFLVWGVGLAGVLVTRRKTRRRMATEGVVVPPLRDAIARRRAQRGLDR